MSTKIDSPTHLAQPKNKINKGGLGRAELRAEVLAERTNQWLGKTKLAMPVVFWLYSGTALVLATLVLTFLIFGSYAQTELASGIIGPKGGPKKVNVEKEGEVTSVYVHEGDRVSAGDPLFQIRLSTTVAKSDILASSSSETVGQNKLETIKAPVGGLIYAFSLNVGDNVLPSSSEPPITIAEDGALVTQIAVSVSAQARLSVGSLVI